jgi:anti-sigma factor RsiW
MTIMDRDREHPSPEQLERYFDGELTPDEPTDLRAHLASCAECSAQQAALARLRTLIAMTSEADVQQLDSERMFAAIERGIAQDIPSTAPAIVEAPARPRIAAPSRLRRLSNAAPVLGAFALAAAAMLMVYRPDGSQTDGNDDTYDYQMPEEHSEVVEVDFGSNAGTVFDISLSDGSSTPVVWIDDDDEE